MAVLQVVLVLAIVAVLHEPLGDYLAKVLGRPDPGKHPASPRHAPGTSR